MPGSDEKRTNLRFQVTLDRGTIRTVERVQTKILGSGSRSAAIRYLATFYDEVMKRRDGRQRRDSART
jgi:hypothetical protein